MNIGVDIDGVLTDLERMALDFGTKMCVEENIPIELNLSKYWEIEKYNWTKEQEELFKIYEDMMIELLLCDENCKD